MNHPYPFLDAPRRPVAPALIDALRALFGDRLSTAQAVRDHHGRDESPFPVVAPDAVVFAHTTDEFARNISVSIGPGATQLTVMPRVASSSAHERVSPTKPAFAAE